MNLLAAYICTQLAEGAPALPLERLIRRVEDDEWRDMIGKLIATPLAQRSGVLLDGVSRMQNAERALDSLRWAETDSESVSQEIAKLFPQTIGANLEDASRDLQKLDWLWPGWLPFGALSILCGDKGYGKSFVALRIAQAALGSDLWPDGEDVDEIKPPRSAMVCWIDTEARYPLLLERATRWPIDRSRISWPLDPENERRSTPAFMLDYPPHWKLIRDYIADWRPQLTVIDSLSGGHDIDENKGLIKPLIRSLSALAEDLQIAILATHLPRKRRQGDESRVIASADELAGNKAHKQFAQSILLLDQVNPHSPTLRLRVGVSNCCKPPRPLSVVIGDDGLACEPAEECIAYSEGEIACACDFLRAALEKGPRLSTEIRNEGVERGIPARRIRAAKERLGVLSERRGTPGFRGGGRTVWTLPEKGGGA